MTGSSRRTDARPLDGRVIVTTRDRPTRLDALLADAGAEVLHVPLIEIADPVDGGAALRDALGRLTSFDWLIVTSRHGARRVGDAAAAAPDVRLASVGRSTADALAGLAGRPVDVVPARQAAHDLARAMPPPTAGSRVLLAQADRADDTLETSLEELGYVVERVTAYRTIGRTPTADERARAVGAHAVTFASGSAAQAWAAEIGSHAPLVVVIGPTTAAVAEQVGLKPAAIATDHSTEGLCDAVVAALGIRS